MIAGARTLNAIDRDKGPYWPKTMEQEERNRSIESFLADRIVRKAFAKLDDGEKTEMAALHESDWLVFKSAPNPTESVAQSAMSALYKRGVA